MIGNQDTPPIQGTRSNPLVRRIRWVAWPTSGSAWTTTRRGWLAAGLAWLAAGLAWLATGLTAQAHPFHVSLAEVEFNGARSRLEVALRVHPLDLEQALRPLGGPPVDLDATPDIDRRLADYLTQVFRVRTPDGTACRISWIGKEISLKDAWLYFEVALPADCQAVVLSNRLLFDLQQDQVNTLNLRIGPRRATLRCSADEPAHEVPLR